MKQIDAHVWPVERIGQALEALADAAELPRRSGAIPGRPPQAEEAAQLDRWVQSAADWLGLEAEPVETGYATAERFVRYAPPILLHLPSGLLALVRRSGRDVVVVGPDLRQQPLEGSVIADALQGGLESAVSVQVDSVLEHATVSAGKREKARRALLAEWLGPRIVAMGWLLRLAPHAPLVNKARRVRLLSRVVVLLAAYAGAYGLYLVSWWLLGRGALQGRLDRGWLIGWLLLLLTLVPLRAFSSWLQGRFAIDAGALLKSHLLSGALRLGSDETRSQGVGSLLGRVFESEAIESLALGGGFASLVAAIELCAALAVLAMGAGGPWHVAILLGWVALATYLGWRYLHWRRMWTRSRVELTHSLVEQMVGHRTRLAQQEPGLWHEEEDRDLERYLGLSQQLDGASTRLTALLPRGWMVLGLAGLAPSFVHGGASQVGLAISLGGIILAGRALQGLVGGAAQISGALIAWEATSPLFAAASKPQLPASPTLAAVGDFTTTRMGNQAAVLQAHDLTFAYRTRAAPALAEATLALWQGDRVLLEGPSGGGKSTLASLLTCLREQRSGLLLLGGLDRHTLGEQAWRRHVVAAPQFHENHVLAETFAFNLLMGRRWPPEASDIEEAQQICGELGLDDLIARMPAGLLQMVGETGWQLSHGERSRLYIARALLQEAQVLVLDESFAALDPESLGRALRCVLQRAKTLVVVAHP